jgi:hypothetical protein
VPRASRVRGETVCLVRERVVLPRDAALAEPFDGRASLARGSAVAAVAFASLWLAERVLPEWAGFVCVMVGLVAALWALQRKDARRASYVMLRLEGCDVLVIDEGPESVDLLLDPERSTVASVGRRFSVRDPRGITAETRRVSAVMIGAGAVAEWCEPGVRVPLSAQEIAGAFKVATDVEHVVVEVVVGRMPTGAVGVVAARVGSESGWLVTARSSAEGMSGRRKAN